VEDLLKSKSTGTSSILSEIFNKNYTSELKTKKQSSQPISYFKGKTLKPLNDLVVGEETLVPRSQTPNSSTFKLFDTEKKPIKKFYKA
jgi:hypothetical protein